MPAKITYFKLEDLSEGENNQAQAWVEGTRAEILLTSPTSPAIGKANDSTFPMSFLPGVGWSEGSKLSTDGQSVQFPQMIAAANVLPVPSIPLRGNLAVIGTSTVANGYDTLANGVVVPNFLSMWHRANAELGNRYNVKLYGYAGQSITYVESKLDELIAANAAAAPSKKISIIALHLCNNDLLANDLASAEACFVAAKRCVGKAQAAGMFPILVTPHLQTDVAGKWGPTVAYDCKCQEWGLNNNVMVVSGAYAIAAHTDKTGTAKSGAMGDTFHVNPVGATYYVQEILSTINGTRSWRMLAASNSDWAGQVFANPHATGSGTATGTGVSGTRCSNVTVARAGGSATIVCSVGTDTNVMDGSYMDLSITFTAADEGVSITESVAQALYLSGKSYVGMQDVEIISGTGVLKAIVFNQSFSSGAILTLNSLKPNVPLAVKRYYNRSVPYSVAQVTPGTTTNNQTIVYSYAAGSAVVRLWAHGVRETESV